MNTITTPLVQIMKAKMIYSIMSHNYNTRQKEDCHLNIL